MRTRKSKATTVLGRTRQPIAVGRSIAEIPAFQSEEEERAFWATRIMGPELFESAEPDPELLALLPPVRSEPPHPSATISLRMDAEVLARLRAVAKKCGIGYQSLLKDLIAGGLAVEEGRGQGGDLPLSS